jgi:DNA replication and repair protein RecF
LRLLRLAAQGFRNLEPLDLQTDARFVVFVGRNAQGKTNALEAVYLLATLKPLRARRTKELVRWGVEEAQVAGLADAQGLRRRYKVVIGEKRRAEVDGKAVPTSDYFSGIRAIAFTPSDAAVVTGEPARRRAWLDRAAFTASPAHLEVVQTWRRLLDQKGAALRTAPDPAVLDALDEAFAVESARLVTRRRQLLQDLAPHVQKLHLTIAATGQKLSIAYRTSVTGDTPEARAASMREQLGSARRREIERKTPLVGPQTDDVELLLDGRSARSYGSQGQVRSAVLALKLAELVAAERRGELPLFLLDDVGSELDRERKKRLVGLLMDLGAQVFVTTTDRDHVAELPEAETKYVRVEGGVLSPDGSG